MKNETSFSRVPEDATFEIHGHGKITQSLVTEEIVEQRARELALMDGRGPNRITTSDRLQAKKELLGDDSADAAADEQDIVTSGMGAPPTSTGTHTKPLLPEDDQVEIQTVQEGVDEAAHDQMLAASQTRTRSEG